jgi:hypothetical protein
MTGTSYYNNPHTAQVKIRANSSGDRKGMNSSSELRQCAPGAVMKVGNRAAVPTGELRAKRDRSVKEKSQARNQGALPLDALRLRTPGHGKNLGAMTRTNMRAS